MAPLFAGITVVNLFKIAHFASGLHCPPIERVMA
jgi:hypothetical protein